MIGRTLEDALNCDDIHPIIPSTDSIAVTESGDFVYNFSTVTVSTADLITWARKMNYYIPEEMQRFVPLTVPAQGNIKDSIEPASDTIKKMIVFEEDEQKGETFDCTSNGNHPSPKYHDDATEISSPIIPAEDIDNNQDCPGNDIMTKLKNEGVDTNYFILGKTNDDCNGMTDDDCYALYRLITPKKKTTQKNLIERNNRIFERKVKAVNFMLAIINANCKCCHNKLAAYAKRKDTEWNKTKPHKELSPDQLMKLAILIVPKERRFGKRSYYDSSKCKCPENSHTA